MPLGELVYWIMPEPMVMPVMVAMMLLAFLFWLIGCRGIAKYLMLASLCFVLLPVLLGPVIAEILAHTPLWLVAIVLVAFAMYFVRLVLSVFIGREGAGHFLGTLAVAGIWRLFALPFRVVGWGIPALTKGAHHVWRSRSLPGLIVAALLGLAAAGLGYWIAAFVFAVNANG